MSGTPLLVVFAVCAVVSCAPASRDQQTKPGEPSPYLLVSAGDGDEADSDFLAVIDVEAGYVSLKKPSWPHGASGAAWGHAALFLPQSWR